MRTYQESGSSVEEATQKILRTLTLNEFESYDVQVLTEAASKGFLGMMAQGDVRVELTVREDKPKKAEFKLRELLTRMGYEVPELERSYDDESKTIELMLRGEGLGKLIG